MPPEVQAARQDGWVRRPDGLAERAGETPVPKLEVALLGVTVFRQPGVAASAPPGRSRWARGLDWAVMPLQVTILLGMGLVARADRRRA